MSRTREEVEAEAGSGYPSAKVHRKLSIELLLDIRELLVALKNNAEGSR